MRLVVDCREGDNSAVFPREMLDDPTPWAKEWLFDSDETGVLQFDTEEQACEAQRAYRISKGFDPTTGL